MALLYRPAVTRTEIARARTLSRASTLNGCLQRRAATYRQVPLAPEIGVVALELQVALAATGTLRAVGPIDLLIAATAVHHDLTILHYDADFEFLAEVDDRVSQHWVVPRGSVT